MAIFQFFKMAAVRHLGFSKVGNFNFWSHSEAQYASAYQISRRSVEPFRRYGQFSIFQDGGRRHLGFWKFQIFNCCDAQEGRTASACQILTKSLKTRLPSWIGFTSVGTTHEEYLVVFVTVHNLMVIGAVISTVCKF